MSHEQDAIEIAGLMTRAGITPETEKQHIAYNEKYDTLSYAVANEGPRHLVLSDDPYGPCNIHRYCGTWVLFDKHGSCYYPILWRDNAWIVGARSL